MLTNNVFKLNADIKGTESFKLVETTRCYHHLNHKTMETPQVLAVFIQLADFCCMVRQGLELLELWLASALG